MGRGRKYLQDAVLLVATTLVAAQVLLSAMPFSLVQSRAGAWVGQLVICSAHGLMSLDEDGSPVPVTPTDKPACPWCLVSSKAGWDSPGLPLLAIGTIPVPVLLHARMQAAAFDPKPPLLERVASSPRAPPATRSV